MILMLGAAAGVPLLQKQPLTQRVLVSLHNTRAV